MQVNRMINSMWKSVVFSYIIKSIKIAKILFLLSFLCGAAHSKEISVWFDSQTGVALGGFDTVSYFTRRKITSGFSDYQVTENGVTWYFENIGNKEAFERHSYVYKPQFSGYDPYAISQGKIAKGLPTLWLIHKKRLYLFQNIINKRLWLYDVEGHKKMATEKWPKLSKNLIAPIKY